MKKSISCILALATMFSISIVTLAAETVESNIPNVQYIDYDLNELIDDNGIMPFATTAKKDATVGTVSANLIDAEGPVIGSSATFKFSGIPTGAKIKDIQAWNPSKSNISQNRFTGIENIQIVRDGVPSEWFRYWIMPEPTLSKKCNTSSFNNLLANATYSIRIQGTVINNESGFDGFTVRGTKVRVT